jgi:hypothetical protein
MNLTQTLLAYVRRYPGASYVNLQREAEQAGFDVHGDMVLAHEQYPTILSWAGMSDQFADAMLSLIHGRLVKERPTCLLVYLVDGGMLRCPLAKQLRAYKTHHWCPVVFDPITPGDTTHANLSGRQS